MSPTLEGSETSLSDTNALPLDAHTETLSILAGCLDRFVAAWDECQEPPALGDFLAGEGEMRLVTLIELIKIDIEYRWLERNLPKSVDEYAAEFPELAEEGVPAVLIYEEFHARKNCGLNADPEDYIERYPARAAELRCLLNLNDPYESTHIYDPKSSSLLDDIHVGETLDDFELLAPLGRGAFARVFLARQTSMQRLVALKVSADSGTEPQTLAQLDHDHIVRVFDQRALPDRKLRLLYMQYVAGGTLQPLVKLLNESPRDEQTGGLVLKAVDRALDDRGESRPLESITIDRLKGFTWPEAVCWLGSRLAGALDYAHNHPRGSILHRDVKPANVLLTAEGVPKLADFNISFSSMVTGATPAAYFGGSLAYMSPEQLEASNPAHERQPDTLDGRSDLYSLGVMLWELLAGERPFQDEKVSGGWAKTLGEMAARRRAGVDEAAESRLPRDCPHGVVRVLRKCLEPDADDRWQSGAELAEQLDLCRKPAALKLIYPATRSLTARLRPYSLLLIFLAAAIPNLLAAAFNENYNWNALVEHRDEEFRKYFNRLKYAVNGVAFSIGLGGLMCRARSVVKQARGAGGRTAVDRRERKSARTRCLRLGHFAAVIGVTLWAIAGVTYPVALRISAEAMPAVEYAYWFGSLCVCGMVAAAYPFFGVTFFCVRELYPDMLRGDLSSADDVDALTRLKRLAWAYLIFAAMCPMLAIAGLSIVDREETFALGVFIGCGIAGFALVAWVCGRLQADLEALIEAMATR